MSRASAALSANRHAEALDWIDNALAVRPRDVQALNARGTVLGSLGRLDEAIASFERAAAQRPGDPGIWCNIARALRYQSRHTEALSHFERALALSPNYCEALEGHGLTLHALGRYDDAVVSLERAASLRPKDPHPRFDLGSMYLEAGNPTAARGAFESALAIQPNHAAARLGLARALFLLGFLDESARNFRLVLQQSPNNASAIEGLAEIYRYLERDDEFVADCRKLVASVPTAAAAWLELGVSLATLNRRAESDECFQRVLALQPGNALARARIGWTLTEQGDFEKARQLFKAACELQPNSPAFWHGLVGVTKVEPSDGIVHALEALRRTCDVGELAHLHFAMGKALADIGDHEQSFSHYLEGNRQRRKQTYYDEKTTLNKIVRTGNSFSSDTVRRCAGSGEASAVPIFILGMPRTGSTLVEQILASHNRVLALGELRSFNQAVTALNLKKGLEFPSWLEGLTADDLMDLSKSYLARLTNIARARYPSFGQEPPLRIVDKMPTNFQYAGLIRLAFPNARIIHTRREAVDTCLSCFKGLFGSTSVPYSYDLAELGRYYAHYDRLMAVWTDALPADSLLLVEYEAMVQDFEGIARKIVSHCGLEWDERCLSFHDTARPVRTLSAVQVRQPLYSTSLRKWRPPSEILRPLLDAMAS